MSRSPRESPHFQDLQPLRAQWRQSAGHVQSASKRQKKVRQSSNLREITLLLLKRISIVAVRRKKYRRLRISARRRLQVPLRRPGSTETRSSPALRLVSPPKWVPLLITTSPPLLWRCPGRAATPQSSPHRPLSDRRSSCWAAGSPTATDPLQQTAPPRPAVLLLPTPPPALSPLPPARPHSTLLSPHH